jgi:sulfate adenylyltransferase
MLIEPYGGALVDRCTSDKEWTRHLNAAGDREILLKHEDQINVINIVTGSYSPLTGFMTEQEYGQVVADSKLPSGLDWTIPILLPVLTETLDGLTPGASVILSKKQGHPLAVMEVESIFEIDREKHNLSVFGTDSTEHPGVQDCLRKSRVCLGGQLHAHPSVVPDFRYFYPPRELRGKLESTGQKTFTAFSTRNICHVGHEYLHTIALEITDKVGINVITGAQVKGNFLPDVVFDTYEYLIDRYYPVDKVFLNNLRLPPIYAGPKEAFLQAIMLQNSGYTHFIVGRDHAGIGSFYPRYGAQQIFKELDSLSIEILPISEPRYCKVCGKITTENSCRHTGADIAALNGRDVRRFLLEKRYAELKNILREDLQKFLTGLFEEQVADDSELKLKEPRRIFYD